MLYIIYYPLYIRYRICFMFVYTVLVMVKLIVMIITMNWRHCESFLYWSFGFVHVVNVMGCIDSCEDGQKRSAREARANVSSE